MRDLEKVCIQPKYNYCTGEERFTFIKLPKCLVEDECFIELSMDKVVLKERDKVYPLSRTL